MTLAVVRKDLAVLWASPVPYVSGALFHVVLGLLYLEQLRVRSQAVIQPLFPLAGLLLLAMIPLVTMRAFAEEERSGTLDLLLAVPVGVGRLVVGKWLAAVVTVAVVAAPALLFAGLLGWWGDPDPGPVITGYLGLLLLTAAVSAVGVLTSTLTSSQPVAAMTAFFVVLLLWFAHVGADQVSETGLLGHFSLSERLRGFAGGGIDVADTVFLCCLAAGSLLLAVMAVHVRRER